MKKIYKFERNCGRMGDMAGVFVAEASEIEALIGKNIYYGEVLGKHSEIDDDLAEDHLTVLSDDLDFVTKFIEVMGEGTISGINPLDYYDPEEDEE